MEKKDLNNGRTLKSLRTKNIRVCHFFVNTEEFTRSSSQVELELGITSY